VRRVFELPRSEETSGQRKPRILQWETSGQHASRWHSTLAELFPRPGGCWRIPSHHRGSVRVVGKPEKV